MAKRKTTRKPNTAPKKKQPRAARLPGMDDQPIRQLNNAAADYAEIRDERMALTQREVTLRERVLKLMHQHGRTKYAYHGITIELVPGEETIKVRVKAPDADLEDVPAEAPEEPPADAALEDDVAEETLADA